jgi:MoxR-like ATPase
MKTMLFSLALLAAVPALAQQNIPDIPFDSTADFLKLPGGMNFGEVPGVAVNSKGHVFVFTRSNSAGGPAYAPTAAQLLEIRMIETATDLDRGAAAHELFTERFLIKRPLLRAIEQTRERAPVLLIDEIDRADEEFEGYLLEFLSDFQVTIPELGTIAADEPPVVVITSNRTREVHDALKRRCVYSWIPYPDFEKEYRIVTTKVPGAPERLARQVTAFVQDLRTADLYKAAGVSETLDWAAALVALDRDALDRDVIDETLGILLKNQEDIDSVRGERVGAILARVLA